jgi:hypothetical protein
METWRDRRAVLALVDLELIGFELPLVELTGLFL